MPAAIEWVTRRARTVSWYVTTLMGDRAYDTYVEHFAVRHPGMTPPDERAFWDARYREQEANPGARCC